MDMERFFDYKKPIDGPFDFMNDMKKPLTKTEKNGTLNGRKTNSLINYLWKEVGY